MNLRRQFAESDGGHSSQPGNTSEHGRPRRYADGAARSLREGPDVNVDASPDRTPHTDEHRTRETLAFALAVGEILLAEGMSASDVVAALTDITQAYDLDKVFFDVTYTQLSATYPGARGDDPITAFRVVYPKDLDFTRVRNIDRLLRDITAGLPFETAVATFEYIRTSKPPYSSWVSTLGNAILGVGVILLFTTSWRELVFTLVLCVVIDRLLRVLHRLAVPTLFQQTAGGLLTTIVAAAIAEGGRQGIWPFEGANPSLIIVGGIIMLVAGMTAVGAVLDAIDEFYVTASARMFEVVMRTAGIVAGIIIGLRIAGATGFPLAVDAASIPLGPFAAQVVGALAIAAGFALYAYADRLTLALASTMGLLGWLVYSLMIHWGAGETLSNSLGALVAAFASTLIVRHTSVPGFALISAALLPLVPGLALYSGLLMTVGTERSTSDVSAGGSGLVAALMVALGIAAGASLGTYLGRPLADGVNRRRERRRTRPAAGPVT